MTGRKGPRPFVSSSFFLFLFLLLLPPLHAASPDDALRAIEQLESDTRQAQAFYPNLEVSEKIITPAMLERLRGRAGSNPAESLNEATALRKKLDKKVTWQLKVEICEFGRFLELGKTNRFTYARRRAVLVELHERMKAAGAYLKSHFPKGNPAVELTVQTMGKEQFAACDAFIGHLYKLFKDEVEGKGALGSGGVTSAGGGSGAGGALVSRFDDGDEDDDPPEAVSPTGSSFQTKRMGSYISSYFTWVLGLLGLLALVAVIWHLLRGSKKLLIPGVDSLKGSTKDLPEAENLQGFKGALVLFQKGQTEKALEGFGRVAASKPVEAPRCYYYSVLCHLRLGRIDLARVCLNKLAIEVFSLEEVYRLAITFEEGEAMDVAGKLYRSIAERDGTFKDIQQRLRVLEAAPSK